MKKVIILLGILGAAAILVGISFSASQSASIGIIGGADGPTAIFVTGRFHWEWLLLLIGGLILGFAAGKIFKKKKQ